ncbi:MAG: HAD-IIIA family hydrolase [Gammaproteobacteria bacterium]|nr:HAD-IIIA family hydrolase [Gammaproteobacteria bacterium]
MKKAFELIVFDWDGTLMDSQQRILDCLKAAANDCDASQLSNDEFCNVIGLGLKEATENLYPDFSPDQVCRYADRYRHHYLLENKTHSPLFKDAKDVLHNLQAAGYWLAVATGKGRQGLDLVLKESGLGSCFLSTRCASETFSKPHPQMLEEIMHELAIEPEQTLMIGDTEYDMELAKNAGTHSLAVSYGVHSLDRLLKHEPLGHINHLHELPGWLQGLNRN